LRLVSFTLEMDSPCRDLQAESLPKGFFDSKRPPLGTAAGHTKREAEEEQRLQQQLAEFRKEMAEMEAAREEEEAEDLRKSEEIRQADAMDLMSSIRSRRENLGSLQQMRREARCEGSERPVGAFSGESTAEAALMDEEFHDDWRSFEQN
jgi:predicted metal-dependent peptidase